MFFRILRNFMFGSGYFVMQVLLVYGAYNMTCITKINHFVMNITPISCPLF